MQSKSKEIKNVKRLKSFLCITYGKIRLYEWIGVAIILYLFYLFGF
jgi:hypothetical protein